MSDQAWTVIQGDCLPTLRKLKSESVDALVTDPPSGTHFMGKNWDSDKGGRDQWVAWLTSIMRQVLRVLKPGAYGFVWGFPRTYHWTAWALEDAGFTILEPVLHIHGQGFPKSLNVGKHLKDSEYGHLGSALKPSFEPWAFVQRPIRESSIAKQVLKTGTGAINIDACRVHRDPKDISGWSLYNDPGSENGSMSGKNYPRSPAPDNPGRFPPNLLLLHLPECSEGTGCVEGCPVLELGRQSGVLKSGAPCGVRHTGGGMLQGGGNERKLTGFGDKGTAARFFPCFRYQSKPSKRERNAGCEGIEAKAKVFNGQSDTPAGCAPGSVEEKFSTQPSANNHPTLKSIELMKWLCRLVTPPGGIILDPFCGSGTTGCAARVEGFRFIGIEREKPFCEIARARIAHWEKAEPKE